MFKQALILSFGPLHLTIDDIYLALGYGGAQPPENIQNMITEMIHTIAQVCKPSFCYVIKENIQTIQTGIIFDDTTFKTGKIIASYLNKAESMAFFVATAGKEFEAWLKKLHEKGDVWEMFLADAIGSEIAEATARAAASELENYASQKGLYISNSYSPGYCGWTVKEQQKLFALFPTQPCGVTLTDSSLMLPIKSVSGMIGIGRHIRKKPYGCAICSMKSCYKKRATPS